MRIASPDTLVAGHGHPDGRVPEEEAGEREEREGGEEHSPVFQERVPLSCRIVIPDQGKNVQCKAQYLQQ